MRTTLSLFLPLLLLLCILHLPLRYYLPTRTLCSLPLKILLSGLNLQGSISNVRMFFSSSTFSCLFIDILSFWFVSVLQPPLNHLRRVLLLVGWHLTESETRCEFVQHFLFLCCVTKHVVVSSSSLNKIACCSYCRYHLLHHISHLNFQINYLFFH